MSSGYAVACGMSCLAKVKPALLEQLATSERPRFSSTILPQPNGTKSTPRDRRARHVRYILYGTKSDSISDAIVFSIFAYISVQNSSHSLLSKSNPMSLALLFIHYIILRVACHCPPREASCRASNNTRWPPDWASREAVHFGIACCR